MIFGTPDLKKQALAAAAALEGRVGGVQSGITTYFDVLLQRILDGLFASEDVHRWDVMRQAPAGSEGAARIADLRWFKDFIDGKGHERFVAYGDRREEEYVRRETEIGSLELYMSQGTTECLTWKGYPLFKCAYDFALMPMLIAELRPATVFEIGSGNGSSARWLADLLRVHDNAAPVYSVDTRAVTERVAGVTFLAGNSASPASLFDAALLTRAAHPWLVVEDAHVNVEGVLAFLDQWLTAGDYVVVEDSRVNVGELEGFFEAHGERYRVDTHYTDFFGRNATSASNSIIRRM